MREIKFSYMWHNGIDWLDLRYDLIQIQNGEPYEYFENEPLLKKFCHKATRQFTGLKDQNGTDIYEGDIIALSCGCCFYKVVWDDKKLRWWPVDDGLSQVHCEGFDVWAHKIEIAGNIYEDPELAPPYDQKADKEK